ncbi:MAG TPA: sulfatase-like hydrolase/transferase, partial [Polyangia bacterium]|nr:sulfatase-like hydrolase/transferase [Polyangia bacterium]
MSNKLRFGTTAIGVIGLGAILVVAADCSKSSNHPNGDMGVADLSANGDGPIGGSQKKNIIFILTDDLAWNLVKYMPHVLQMQQQGMTFSQYFVTDSLCCPSRSSIFTGKFPHDTTVFTNTAPNGGYAQFENAGNAPQTFSVALQTAGYKTAMMGKYLNGYDPTKNQADPGWGDWDVAGDGYPEFNYQ